MPVVIGTSGWQYRHWRGGLYLSSMPASDFNNDSHRCAPRDAHGLGLALGKHAFLTTRVPAARETPLSFGKGGRDCL